MGSSLRGGPRSEIFAALFGSFLSRGFASLRGRRFTLGRQLAGILQGKLARWFRSRFAGFRGRPQDFAVYKLIAVGVDPFAVQVGPAIGGLGQSGCRGAGIFRGLCLVRASLVLLAPSLSIKRGNEGEAGREEKRG